MQDIISTPLIRGRLTANNGRKSVVVKNQIQLGWGAATAKLLATGNKAYSVSTMYIEYENVASEATIVPVPVYTRSEGREYYENLSLLPNRDFLRVPLLLPAAVSVESGYEDFIPPDEGNLLTFYTQTQGVIGYHGRTFSNTVNSKVFGAALVVTPDPMDPVRDIIVARTYLNPGDQLTKIASGQVGMTWQLSLL